MAVRTPEIGSPRPPLDEPALAFTDEEPGRPHRLPVALVIAIVLFLLLAQRVFVYTPDDAFITYRYSRNVAEGFGPVFNRPLAPSPSPPRGEGSSAAERTEGFSCPLFMYVMAVVMKLPLGLDVLFRAKLLGIVCGVATLIIAFRLAERLKLPSWAVAAAPILLAVHSSLVVTSVNGMETVLQTLLVTSAAYALIGEWLRRERGEAANGFVSGLLFAAVALNRPEGLLYGVAGVVWMAAVRAGRLDRVDLQRLGAFLIPLCLYLVFRHAYYGLWLPNTYYAKAVGIDAAATKGAGYLLRTFFYVPTQGWSSIPDSQKYALIGSGLLWWITVFAGVASPRFWRAPASLVSTMAAMQILFLLKSGEDGMGGWRFMAPVVPLLTLLAIGGMAWLVEGLMGFTQTRPRLLRNALGGTLTAVVLVVSLIGDAGYWPHAWEGYSSWASTGFTLNQRNLLSGWLMGMTPVVSDWLNAHVPAGSTIAYTEMGGTPYYSPNIRFLDANGLTDHGVATVPGAAHWGNGVEDYYVTMNGVLGPYFRDVRKPDYVMLGTELRTTQEPPREPILGDAYRFEAAVPLPSTNPETRRYMLIWKRAM